MILQVISNLYDSMNHIDATQLESIFAEKEL